MCHIKLHTYDHLVMNRYIKLIRYGPDMPFNEHVADGWAGDVEASTSKLCVWVQYNSSHCSPTQITTSPQRIFLSTKASSDLTYMCLQNKTSANPSFRSGVCGMDSTKRTTSR